MADDPATAHARTLITLRNLIAQTERQAALLRQVIALRMTTGSGCERLEQLVRDTEMRLEHLRAEQKRLAAGR
jgi:hypothetical protein